METENKTKAPGQPAKLAETATNATVAAAYGKKPGKITGGVLLASLILVLMIIFLFVLKLATSSNGGGIKLSDIVETCQGSTGYCMMKGNAGFFRIFAYIVPILWLLAAITAYIKKNIAIVLTIFGTMGYILLDIFATAAFNKVYGDWIEVSLSFAFWLTIALSIIAIICLAKKPKN